MAKYYLIAGEASGDLHGGNLIKALHRKDAQADIRCWGGDKMEAAGATLVKHYRDLAFMGFVEVIANLGTILRNLKRCKEDIKSFAPEVLVLIDYPGFNLRIAKWAHEQGMKVVFYISPQVWAWKEGRVKQMKQTIDKMLVILPFEEKWYRDRWQWEVQYVGHPLIEEIEQRLAEPVAELIYERPMVALLPGSRKQEIAKKLPVMLSVAEAFPAFQFVVAQAPGLPEEVYAPYLTGRSNVALVRQATYNLLRQSEAALVTSGTATLETALLKVPEVVCYKGNSISYRIARWLIDIPFISLVNLIAGRKVVEELIQHDCTPPKVEAALRPLLDRNSPERRQMLSDYEELYGTLKAGGHASDTAAAAITAML